ncbi:MAG: hypothetical protein R6U85_11475 [Salinivirgaceae bacterium]
MFYIGFLSSSIPYILFLLVTVFYLGFNFLNPQGNDVPQELIENNELSVQQPTKEIEERNVDFNTFYVADFTPEIKTQYLGSEIIQPPRPKPLTPHKYSGNLWARPPPFC